MSERKKDESFGVVVFCRDDKGAHQVLMLKHAYGTKHWSLPKGHRDEGESDHTAAFRELSEETGLTEWNEIPDVIIEDNYSFDRDDVTYEKTVKNYFAEIECNQEIRVQPEEISEYRWVSEENYLELELFETQHELLKKIFAQLRNII